MADGRPRALVPVRLVASERVVPGGTHRVTWSVHVGGHWVPAKDVPGVGLEHLSPGPGTIWEIAHELELGIGTWLRRQEATPLAWENRDPMKYLEREQRGVRQRVRRRHFRVARGGELRPVAADDAPI